MIDKNIFLFSVDGKDFYVEIPEMYINTKHIHHHIVDQLDFAYIEHGVNFIKKYKNFSEVTQRIIKLNRNQLTKIWYKDFDRAITYRYHNFAEFLKHYKN